MSIHPGRKLFGSSYNPRLSLIRVDDRQLPITRPAKDRSKGILGKRVKRLEARRKDYESHSELAKVGLTAPGSMQ